MFFHINNPVFWQRSGKGFNHQYLVNKYTSLWTGCSFWLKTERYINKFLGKVWWSFNINIFFFKIHLKPLQNIIGQFVKNITLFDTLTKYIQLCSKPIKTSKFLVVKYHIFRNIIFGLTDRIIVGPHILAQIFHGKILPIIFTKRIPQIFATQFPIGISNNTISNPCIFKHYSFYSEKQCQFTNKIVIYGMWYRRKNYNLGVKLIYNTVPISKH